jgi:hypothetical protein
MTKPTIHLNGTAAADLLKQYRSAYAAVSDAIEAICKASPHGRDYYPQGTDAINNAQSEHWERVAKLREVEKELMELALHVYQEVK